MNTYFKGQRELAARLDDQSEPAQSAALGRHRASPAGSSAGGPATVAVVDRRPLLRDCMSLFLSTLYNVPISSCASVDEFLASRSDKDPSLVLLSAIDERRNELLEDLDRLCQECAGCPILVILNTCNFDLVSETLQKGAAGVLPTNLTTEVAAEAIGLVIAGGTFIPRECLERETRPAAANTPYRPGVLTPRETEILTLLRSGKQNKQIAHVLGLSEGTVKVHLHNMMRKLGTANRTETIMSTLQV